MRRAIALFVLFFVLLSAALALPGCSGTKHEDVPLDGLPPRVKAGFEKEYPGARIKEIEKETYSDGTVHYEIHFIDKNGKSSEVEVNTDGEVLPEH